MICSENNCHVATRSHEQFVTTPDMEEQMCPCSSGDGGGGGAKCCRNINRTRTGDPRDDDDVSGGGPVLRQFHSQSVYRVDWRFRFRFSLAFLIALLLIISSWSPAVAQSSEEQPSNTLVSQSEIKTIEPTNNPTKVFVRRRIFRKLVKEGSNNGSSSHEEQPVTTPSELAAAAATTTTTVRPRTLYSLVKRLDKDSSSTVTGNSLKSSMSTSVSLSARQKFNFASLKTRLGLAATEMTTNQPTTTTTSPPSVEPESSSSSNNSLVMIPLPPSQRKPYTPVIMQVTKSTTAKPTMQTYKLNKMFVPIGIYGKVVENGTDEGEQRGSTPGPEIRHKGTDSGEKQQEGAARGSSGEGSSRKHKGIAESVDLTYRKPDAARISLTTERPDIGSISITTEASELFGSVMMNGLRRGDQYGSYSGGGGGSGAYYGGNTNKNQGYGSSSSGLTLMTPPKLGSEDDSSSDPLASSYASYASYSPSYSPSSSPHKKFTPSSIVDSITDSMSRIPSLFHKGLTSLTSLTSSLKENPFVDENFSESAPPKKQSKPLVAGGYTPKIPASVPGGYIHGMKDQGGQQQKQRHEQQQQQDDNDDDTYASGSETLQTNKYHQKAAASQTSSGLGDMSEYETLEYFRKRPHLLAQLQQQQQKQKQSSWRRAKNYRMSKGFKPATAPDLLAREYYKSTSTTQMTPETSTKHQVSGRGRGSKHMRGSWLLRNSNEYVANRNEKLVNMWRNMLDSFTEEDEEDDEDQQQRQQQYEEETPSQTKMASRRSSSGGKHKSPLLTAQWSSIKSKYSKDQIKEAKDRILTLLNSGYGDEALLDPEVIDEDELQAPPIDYDTASHMPPPPPPRIKALSLTKGLSGAAAGAFRDIVKFFKLGVSVGTGQAREPVNYEQVVDLQEEEEQHWKPVRRPLISFSAGISLKNPTPRKPTPTPPHHHHHHLHSYHSPTSHLEEEEELDHHHGIHLDTPLAHVEIPSPTLYEKPTTYVEDLLAPQHYESHDVPPKSVSYASYNSEVVATPAQSLDYVDDDPEEGYESTRHTYVANAPARYSTSRPSNYYDYSTLKSGAQSWTPVKSGGSSIPSASDYELVPSSVYLNGQNDPRDIAAVVKPAGISDELVRSALPARLRNLRILDYPNEYASLNSISAALQQGGQVADSVTRTSFKAAMKKLRENYVAKESSYLPQSAAVSAEQLLQGGLEEIEAPRGLGSGLRSQSVLSSLSSNGGGGAGLSSLSGLSGSLAGSSLAGLTLSSGLQSTRGSSNVPSYASYPSVSPLSSFGNLQATYYSPLLQQQQQQQSQSLLLGNPRESVFATANRINNLGRGSSSGVAAQFGSYAYQQPQPQQQQQITKDQLGFTNDYNLPQHLDPDIAAILKSELDKDDIPEDVRQEFLDAKEEEKKKKKQQQTASRRVDDAQQSLIDSLLNTAIEKSRTQQYEQYEQAPTEPAPTQPTYYSTSSSSSTPSYPPPQPQLHQQQQYYVPTSVHHHQQQQPAQSRAYHGRRHPPPPPPPPMPQAPAVLTTKFFAPIPITPTLMTTAMRNPRYSSPVPRYVIELAKKLQGDKSVQGIVRVSAKRGRGLPPIEYLYPVKG